MGKAECMGDYWFHPGVLKQINDYINIYREARNCKIVHATMLARVEHQKAEVAKQLAKTTTHPQVFRMGETVKYMSKQHKGWVIAQVLTVDPLTGRATALDCADEVDYDLVKKLSISEKMMANNRETFDFGERVKYMSEAKGEWVYAKVLDVDPFTNKCTDLNIARNVDSRKVRKLTNTERIEAQKQEEEAIAAAKAAAAKKAEEARLAKEAAEKKKLEDAKEVKVK